jgi:hypothetical protein
MEAFDSSSSFGTDNDESLLLSPPPGALWNALNLVGSSNKPTTTTGLVVVSPQAAAQIHHWSTSGKKKQGLQHSTVEVASSQTTGNHEERPVLLSPTVPRTLLLETPEATVHQRKMTVIGRSSDTSSEEIVEKHHQSTSSENKLSNLVAAESAKLGDPEGKCDRVIQRSSKGGVAMDMSQLFTPDGTFVIQKDEIRRDLRGNVENATPLSASVPAALLSRLTANRRTSPRKVDPSLKTETKQKAPLADRNARKPPPTMCPKRSSNTVKNSTPEMRGEDLARHHTRNVECNSKHKKNVTGYSAKPGKADLQQPLPKPESKELHHNMPWKSQRTRVTVSNTERVLSDLSLVEVGSKLDISECSASTSTTNKKIQQDAQSTQLCQHHCGGVAFDDTFQGTNNSAVYPLPTRRVAEKNSDSRLVATEQDYHESLSWADKQCESFVGWLNYLFNPEDEDGLLDGTSSSSGLRTLLLHRRLAQGRNKAMEIFQDTSMRHMRDTVLIEITRGRLSIRADRDVTADVQLRKQLVTLLLSYTTPWLRLALEVMFGESIEPSPVAENGPKVCCVSCASIFPCLGSPFLTGLVTFRRFPV